MEVHLSFVCILADPDINYSTDRAGHVSRSLSRFITRMIDTGAQDLV
jgi:hypothetical protein